MNHDDDHAHDHDLAGMHPADDMLFDYVEGSMGPALTARIAEHLAGCEHCRTLVELSAVAAARAPVRLGTVEAMPVAVAARLDIAVDAEFARLVQRREKARRMQGARGVGRLGAAGWRRWVLAGATGLAMLGGVVAISHDPTSRSHVPTSAAGSTSSDSAATMKRAETATAGAAGGVAGGAATPSVAQPSVAGAPSAAGAAGAAGASSPGANAASDAATSSSAGLGAGPDVSPGMVAAARDLQASPYPSLDASGTQIAYGLAGTDASTAVADVLVPLRLPCVVTLVRDGSGVLVGTRLAGAPNVTGSFVPLLPTLALICRNDAPRAGAATSTTKPPISPYSLVPVDPNAAGSTPGAGSTQGSGSPPGAGTSGAATTPGAATAGTGSSRD